VRLQAASRVANSSRTPPSPLRAGKEPDSSYGTIKCGPTLLDSARTDPLREPLREEVYRRKGGHLILAASAALAVIILGIGVSASF
jgi:hypothetical protein